MGARTRIHALSLAAASLAGCSTANETDLAFLPPGGWDQNGYWNSTFTRFVPGSSPRWPGPKLLHETFNANNHLSLVPRGASSPCGTTRAVSVRGSRFENGRGIGPRLWLDTEQRWLAIGESVTYAATLRNDADWSIPVTITALRTQDLAVESVDDVVSPTYDVTLRRDADCVPERLGINQLGPVPVVPTVTARFTPAAGAYAYYKTYYGGQERTEAVPAKIMVNAGLLQPMPGEPDDFYETCTTHQAVPAAKILFDASTALSAMTWVDVVGSATLDTGVQMTVPGQRVRIHMLVNGEALCHRRGFPGRRVVGLGPPRASEPNPTSIDVVQVDDTAFVASDRPVTIGHHAMHGTSTARASVWLSMSTDPDRFAYHTQRESRVRETRVGNVSGPVTSWQQLVGALLSTANGTSVKARMIAAAVTPAAGSPDHFEAPAEQTQSMDWCGNGYCWSPETTATCPVDCGAPGPGPGPGPGPSPSPGMDAGVFDAMTLDAMPVDAPGGGGGPGSGSGSGL